LKKNELIFSNSESLLREILTAKEKPQTFDLNFKNFTVIKLSEQQQVFGDVFKTMENEEVAFSSTDFFTKNIGSLLNVVSQVERIEIKTNSEKNFLFEEIDFVLKEKPD
jgi:hypothetical protein